MFRIINASCAGLFILQIAAFSQTAEVRENNSKVTPFPAPFEFRFETNAPDATLLQKHDFNQNGKIDVGERKQYVRERARLTRARLQAETEARRSQSTNNPARTSSNTLDRVRPNQRNSTLPPALGRAVLEPSPNNRQEGNTSSNRNVNLRPPSF